MILDLKLLGFKQKRMSPAKLIFIDLSYYVIHRYFATLRFFKFKGVDEPEKADVYKRFEKSFVSDLGVVCLRHGVEMDDVVFAKDTPRDTIWRMALFREYKSGRASLTKFDPEIFKHVETVLLPRLSGVRVVGCDRAEADDIIAIARRLYVDAEMVIITGDHDYLQLLGPRTTIVNANNEALTKKYTPEMLEVFLEYKVCKGDPSDNIPSIGKKIGDKTALKLARDPAALAARIAADPAVGAQYELNKRLMSFDCIPGDVVDDIKRALGEIMI